MPKPHKLFLIALLLLASCSGGETEKPEVSLARQEPSAGMDYRAFRDHEKWGQGDMRDAQKRFLILDRNNNGVISPMEAGGN